MRIIGVYKEYVEKCVDDYNTSDRNVDIIEYDESDGFVDVTFRNGNVRRIFKPDYITF